MTWTFEWRHSGLGDTAYWSRATRRTGSMAEAAQWAAEWMVVNMENEWLVEVRLVKVEAGA